MFDVTTEKEELVYFFGRMPKKLADKLNALKDGKEMEKEIDGFIRESKLDMRASLESLDDAVLQYKASMVKARAAFREAKDEQLTASYQLWEKYEDDLKGITAYIDKIKTVTAPLKRDLEELRAHMQSINTWAAKDFLSILEKIDGSWGNGSVREALTFLFQHFRKPEQG
jgi:DNA repair ATPase RecN